ncbi:unnamed protein product [Acanthosepion pharaonis]|uniref:Uncharacterized protein n=1 Tax=Acanthosepion pharaonis TaxID=158019 RepID=A0A812EZI4_ACAPH|nr:unnamed protein product [Sepia pharaonis]
MLCVGPFVLLLMTFNASHRQVIICGGFVSALSTLASFFAHNVEVLYVTYGILSGTFVGISYFAGNTIVGCYFKKKRTVAVGIAQSGTGVGAFALNYLLERSIFFYGMRGTFLLISGLLLNFLVYGALCRPLKTVNTEKKMKDVMKNPGMQLLLIIYFFWTAGECVILYLPAKAVNVGLTREQGALTMSIYGAVFMLSQIVVGILADLIHIPQSYLLMSSLLGMAATSFAFTFCHSFPWFVLCTSLFAIFHGFTFPLRVVLVSSILGVRNLTKGYSPLCLMIGLTYIIDTIITGK